jgi:glycosyltransferase involved in cell wall biosynthesis
VTKRLSIIIPMRNEEGNVAPLFERLRQLASRVREEFGMTVEVIVNDNQSHDRTFEALRVCAEDHDPQLFDLRIFRFARNIGFQKSILVGYCKAQGDAVVQIDADLQDPPELILEFLRKWQEGYKVVYGVRRRRDESRMMKALRWIFYRFIDRISADDLPHDSGDFRLIDRAMVDIICQLRDHDPYLRGFVAHLGLKQIGIPYDRVARKRGASKFGIAELLKLAVDGITNHSSIPLRLASYVALIVFMVGSLLMLFYLAASFRSPDELPVGFITQTLLQLGSLAVLSFLIAIQGFYIGRIYNQVKERPLAVIEHRLYKGSEVDREPSEMLEKIEVMWTGDHIPTHYNTHSQKTS